MNALALAGLTRLILAFAEPSQPPPPTPTPITEIKQEISNTHAPVSNPTAETAGTIKNCDHANSQSDTRDQESSSNRTIAWLTGVLAFAALVQIGVTVAQARYMRRGLRVSIKAARSARFSAIAAQDAVRLAERATHLTQRAVILIESIKAEPPPTVNTWPLAPHTLLVLTLKNYGATVAHGVTVKGGVIFFGERALEFNGAQGIPIAPQGTNQWITKSLISAVRQDQFERLNGMDPTRLTYRVEVTYVDAFGKPHQYMQEGQYIALLKGFITGRSTSD